MRDLLGVVSSAAAAQQVHVPGTPLTVRLDGPDLDGSRSVAGDARALRRFGTPSQTGDGEITVEDGDASHVLRLDPAEWAAYASLPEHVTSEDIVPTAVPMVDDLPLWVWDEMFEALGSGGPVVGLVDGQLRPLPNQ